MPNDLSIGERRPGLIVSTVQRAYCQMDAESNFNYVLHPDGHLLRFELAEQFLKRHL